MICDNCGEKISVEDQKGLVKESELFEHVSLVVKEFDYQQNSGEQDYTLLFNELLKLKTLVQQ